MLISGGELLGEYRSRGKCIPAFNIYNLETIQAALAAAASEGEPVMLAFGEGYLSHASFEVISAMVRCLAGNHIWPVVLHLDHCKSVEHIREAVAAGFTSVMYDGCRLPLRENIRNTQEVVRLAHAAGVSVEGELGGMNEEDGSGSEADLCFTDPGQAREYVLASGVDSLAVSVGNAHGVYKGKPELDFDRLNEIYEAVKVPLVLHGCSGIPREDIVRAAKIAVAKINVNTEIAMAGASRVRKELASGVQRYEKLTAAAREEMTGIMRSFLLLNKDPIA